VTERAGQAFHVMASTSNKDLYSYDGVVAVVSNDIPSHGLWHIYNYSEQ
jgi:hypothetical protein